MATSDLKNLVSFGLSCGELISGIADGVGFDDVAKVIKVAKEAGSLGKAAAAFEQYKAMTDEEALDLENFVVAEFDIADEVVEAGIEQALKVLIELHSLVNLLVPKA